MRANKKIKVVSQLINRPGLGDAQAAQLSRASKTYVSQKNKLSLIPHPTYIKKKYMLLLFLSSIHV